MSIQTSCNWSEILSGINRLWITGVSQKHKTRKHKMFPHTNNDVKVSSIEFIHSRIRKVIIRRDIRQ